MAIRLILHTATNSFAAGRQEPIPGSSTTAILNRPFLTTPADMASTGCFLGLAIILVLLMIVVLQMIRCHRS